MRWWVKIFEPGERLNSIQKAIGLIPPISTINLKRVVTKITENYGFQ